jgi:Zn-dependent alcohol dehydrogenase
VAGLAKLELEPLISGIEPLERIAEAYAAHKAGEHVKVLLTPRPVTA